MIEFVDCSRCRECDLWEQARNPGVPSRALFVNGRDKAVVFVGEAPGYNEDTEHTCWIGYAGQLLEKFIIASKLVEAADVYLSNACRCRPPANTDPKKGQINTCRQHLIADVEELRKHYKEVVLVSCGAVGLKSFSPFTSIKQAVKCQGLVGDFGAGEVTMFFTYHPASLHQLRQPSKVYAVQTHFALLKRYLTGEYIPFSTKVTPEVGINPPRVVPKGLVSLDIETYGILARNQQTVFHPLKSQIIDGVSPSDMIVTVSVAWEEEDRIRTALYIWDNKAHRNIVRSWLRKIMKEKLRLLGANIKYDLEYLSYCDHVCRHYIDPNKIETLDDTLLLAFLLYSDSPEKGLKELTTLYGVMSYADSEVTGSSGTALSAYDPRLHYYNCKDTAGALLLYRFLEESIAKRYGRSSTKLSPVCTEIRNNIIWCCLKLEQAGGAIDISKITQLHDSKCEERSSLYGELKEGWDITVSGTGSEASLRHWVTNSLVALELLSDSRVSRTDKKKDIGINLENFHLIETEAEILGRTDILEPLSRIMAFRAANKMVNSYTKKLVEKPRHGIVTRRGNIGMVYPTWYPMPSYNSRGGTSDDSEGGQKQGRFSCQRPGRQTEPPEITACYTTRFPGGKLVGYDLSQIELRMAALLSGDPVMMETFEKGISPHIDTAKKLFPQWDWDDPATKEEGHPKEYTLCKSVNFLVIYRGGAYVLQATARNDCGLELPIEDCQQDIDKWYEEHPVFKAWQDRLIDTVSRRGYLELCTGWGRTFGLGPQGVASSINEICNCPVQTLSSQLLQSAQYALLKEFSKRRLRSFICHQVYDSLVVDTYPVEAVLVDSLMDKYLTRPPLLGIIENETGRTIKIAYERKVYAENH